MRNLALVLSLVAACTTLAACGDSGSSPSSSTRTATVPSGKLGTTIHGCMGLPQAPGYVFTSLVGRNVECPEARKVAVNATHAGKVIGWNCTVSTAGPKTTAVCNDLADRERRVTAVWMPE